MGKRRECPECGGLGVVTRRAGGDPFLLPCPECAPLCPECSGLRESTSIYATDGTLLAETLCGCYGYGRVFPE